MRVLNEFVKKKEVKKMRPRLKQADRVREYLQFVDFEPNQKRKNNEVRKSSLIISNPKLLFYLVNRNINVVCDKVYLKIN